MGHKVEELDYTDFYKMFSKGIFRVALVDMLGQIEDISEGLQAELPMEQKLNTLRRNLMLAGVDSKVSE